MNDFLQSLRNNQAEKPRPQKMRKNYDNSFHYTSQPRFQSYGGAGYQNNRNHQHTKRPVSQHQNGNQIPTEDGATPSILAEAIETLNSHTEILAKNQDYLIAAQEKMTCMIERQAIAIEKVLDHLNKVSGQEVLEKNVTAPEKTVEPQSAPVLKSEIDVIEPVEIKKPAKSVIRKKKKDNTRKPIKAASTDNKLLSRDTIMDIIHNMRAEGATFDQVAAHLVKLNQPTFSGRGEWHAQTIHRLCNKK